MESNTRINPAQEHPHMFSQHLKVYAYSKDV